MKYIKNHKAGYNLSDIIPKEQNKSNLWYAERIYKVFKYLDVLNVIDPATSAIKSFPIDNKRKCQLIDLPTAKIEKTYKKFLSLNNEIVEKSTPERIVPEFM